VFLKYWKTLIFQTKYGKYLICGKIADIFRNILTKIMKTKEGKEISGIKMRVK
jgi:hypothetical protein